MRGGRPEPIRLITISRQYGAGGGELGVLLEAAQNPPVIVVGHGGINTATISLEASAGLVLRVVRPEPARV